MAVSYTHLERPLCDARVERIGSRDSAIFSYTNLCTGEKMKLDGLCVSCLLYTSRCV